MITGEIVAAATEKREKATYVGAPACFALEQAAKQICEAFNVSACYVVGSAMEREDWRDVDVRLIMADGDFAKEFPDADKHWEHDARWLLFVVSISAWLSKITGLPIDFQIQPQSHANERHSGSRNAIGMRFAKSTRESSI